MIEEDATGGRRLWLTLSRSAVPARAVTGVHCEQGHMLAVQIGI
ncbi:hypothetical protein LJR231_004039 [Phyllobacterium sp. LjRoot231]